MDGSRRQAAPGRPSARDTDFTFGCGSYSGGSVGASGPGDAAFLSLLDNPHLLGNTSDGYDGESGDDVDLFMSTSGGSGQYGLKHPSWEDGDDGKGDGASVVPGPKRARMSSVASQLEAVAGVAFPCDPCDDSDSDDGDGGQTMPVKRSRQVAVLSQVDDGKDRSLGLLCER